jgi:hypothetical protein
LIDDGIFSGLPMQGMKSDAFMFVELRRQFAEQGLRLATQHIHAPDKSKFILCLDNVLPLQNFAKKSGQYLYLILSEPATYYPHNWNLANHKVFDKIFTYNREMVDNKRYFHYNFAIDLIENNKFFPVSAEEFNVRKLAVMMAASFGVVLPRDSISLLYERYLILKWFAQHHPSEFDLYSRFIHPKTYESFRGLSWLQKLAPAPVTKQITNMVAAHNKALFDIVNKGPVPPDQKIKTLRKYRFNIAYENTGNVPGYLTEKIFDSFAACCVPVYWGDPDVAKSIPKACFIDRRDFASNQELYQFLKSMQYAEYRQYTDAITAFVEGVEQEKFGPEANARRISDVILKDLSW